MANWLLLLLCVGAMQGKVSTFNPSNYAKSAARCTATRREPVKQEVHIDLTYVEINSDARTTLLMVHGWPSLWSTWSNQIEEFQHDYRLIIPDLRGFGESTHPGDVKSSGTLGDMVDDLVCILQQANVESVICIGHDWGSSICYEAARLRPDVVKAVIGLVVPYIPAAGPFVPIKELTSMFPTLTYQVFFDSQTDVAVAELDQDIRRTVRATFRTVASPPPDTFLKNNVSFLSAWDGIEKIPSVPFFTPGEEDYFVDQYSINGFRNTLQFYSNQNRLLGWELANAHGNHTIPQPVLAIYPKQDPVANWEKAARFLQSSKYLPNLTIKVKHPSCLCLEHIGFISKTLRNATRLSVIGFGHYHACTRRGTGAPNARESYNYLGEWNVDWKPADSNANVVNTLQFIASRSKKVGYNTG